MGPRPVKSKTKILGEHGPGAHATFHLAETRSHSGIQQMMSGTGYLAQLTMRLAAGVSLLPEAQRNNHAQFFLNRQRPDGGFAGREGESDLYYTGFGLRGLATLGELKDEPAERAAGFLKGKLTGKESIVDFLSLIYSAELLRVLADIDIFDGIESDWRSAVIDSFLSLRREDGGFAKGAEGHASSTYHTFLVAICLELLGSKIPDPEKIVSFLVSQQAEDGGFREIRVSKRAGTNPTAAAVATLRMLDALNGDLAENSAEFLLDMQNDEGGILANTRIPIADMLSTFTGLVSLSDLGAADQLDHDAILRFVKSLECETGGFIAAAWDEVQDVEYSFYGLGTLGLLNQLRSSDS